MAHSLDPPHTLAGADPAALQARIDAIEWYHEFDFGDGLCARSRTPDVDLHRPVWRFIERQLRAVDFRGKDVLDIGCWDGYWSFFAERRGARSVLAADDVTQNWADGRGLRLAKELLGSNVEVRQDVSIYDLQSLGRRFDIIVCLGVYYHLLDPFYAFAQLRHCCRADTVVLLEGDAGRVGIPDDIARYTLGNSQMPTFVPAAPTLEAFLQAAYLRVQSRAWMRPEAVVQAVGMARRFGFRRKGRREIVDRIFLTCTPFSGANPAHYYKPPFGLDAYDDRYRTAP